VELEPLDRDPGYWDTIETQEFYTLREVGKILRMSKKHVYKRLIRRKLKVDGHVRYVTRLRYHQDGPGAEITVRHRDLVAYVEAMAVNVDPELEGKNP
jgi:hypothetical protein